jgi:hypothetical protein
VEDRRPTPADERTAAHLEDPDLALPVLGGQEGLLYPPHLKLANHEVARHLADDHGTTEGGWVSRYQAWVWADTHGWDLTDTDEATLRACVTHEIQHQVWTDVYEQRWAVGLD